MSILNNQTWNVGVQHSVEEMYSKGYTHGLLLNEGVLLIILLDNEMA